MEMQRQKNEWLAERDRLGSGRLRRLGNRWFGRCFVIAGLLLCIAIPEFGLLTLAKHPLAHGIADFPHDPAAMLFRGGLCSGFLGRQLRQLGVFLVNGVERFALCLELLAKIRDFLRQLAGLFVFRTDFRATFGLRLLGLLYLSKLFILRLFLGGGTLVLDGRRTFPEIGRRRQLALQIAR